MNAIEKWDEMHRPFTDEEWHLYYLRVTGDPRFKVLGLNMQDLMDVTFHLKCWNKTAQDLKKDIPGRKEAPPTIRERAEEILQMIRNSPARWDLDVPKVESILTDFYNDIKRWTPGEVERACKSELAWIERLKQERKNAFDQAYKIAANYWIPFYERVDQIKALKEKP